MSSAESVSITKTCLYNLDPLKPHFYIVKLGFTGVYIIFLISARNIDCGYSLEPPYRGGSNECPQSMFWTEIWKISEFFIWKFSDFGGEIFYMYLNRRVFVMGSMLGLKICSSETGAQENLHKLSNKYLKGCFWKYRTHKRTKALFIWKK